jgi:poly(3-hydroxybutyrate) depolymerase
MRRGPVITVGMGLLACVAACGGGQDAKTPALSHATESWCPERFEAGPGDTCFAIPEHAGKETPVLVYLHGPFAGRGSAEEWAAVSVAVHRGFAVVLPRGRRDLCALRAELKDHYCWPQDAEDTQTIKSVVGEWERVLWQVDTLLEGGAHRRYVLGSDSGAVFASVLAKQNLFGGQAFAVVNGGAPGWPLVKAKPIPMLLVASEAPEGSESPQAKELKALHENLTKATWPHAFCPRPGSGSAAPTITLTSEDVDSALRFFRHDADGSLKREVKDGAYPCEARH